MISSRRRRDIEQGLGKEDWLRLYDAYAQSGIPQVLSDLTLLSLDRVEHMLNTGILRLSLPPIREHARDSATIALATQRQTGLQNLSDPALIRGPEVQAAITNRAVQEAGAAQRALDAAVKANEIFNEFTDLILAKCKAGQIGLPEMITMGTLETLQKALASNTAALDRAVKLSRLTRGETTENIGTQIGALLVDCTLEELIEAEQTGGIPSRILGRFAGAGDDDQQQRQRQRQIPQNLIDIPSDEGDGEGDEGGPI